MAANLLLPEAVESHFDLTKHEIKGKEIHFYFTELNNILDELDKVKFHSKGFFPEATVQDFLIRGKNVYLHITRSRWFNEASNKIVTRDWNLAAKGARINSEFAAFLNEIYT